MQTPAVDMWSLGVVALVLVTSDQAMLDHLNILSQEALDDRLIRRFESTQPRPTFNAQEFIARCLRLLPEDRPTATEAACHDWMCTPDRHADFFRRFDERVMAHWSAKPQMRPMPWDLQALKDAAAADAAEQKMYRATAQDADPDATLVEQPSKYFTFSRTDAPTEDELSLVPMPVRTKVPTWSQAPPVTPTRTRRSRSTRDRRPTPSADLSLPLPSLSRHLGKRAKGGPRREHVLQELRASNIPFLTPERTARDATVAKEALRFYAGRAS